MITNLIKYLKFKYFGYSNSLNMTFCIRQPTLYLIDKVNIKRGVRHPCASCTVIYTGIGKQFVRVTVEG